MLVAHRFNRGVTLITAGARLRAREDIARMCAVDPQPTGLALGGRINLIAIAKPTTTPSANWASEGCGVR
jgi:hypothetical protein